MTDTTIYYEAAGEVEEINMVVGYEVAMPWLEVRYNPDDLVEPLETRIPYERVVKIDG